MTGIDLLVLFAAIYIAPHASERFAVVVAVACLTIIAAKELGAFA
jgi:hypothetical protein